MSARLFFACSTCLSLNFQIFLQLCKCFYNFTLHISPLTTEHSANLWRPSILFRWLSKHFTTHSEYSMTHSHFNGNILYFWHYVHTCHTKHSQNLCKLITYIPLNYKHSIFINPHLWIFLLSKNRCPCFLWKSSTSISPASFTSFR